MTDRAPKRLPADERRLKRIAAKHNRALTKAMLAGYDAAHAIDSDLEDL